MITMIRADNKVFVLVIKAVSVYVMDFCFSWKLLA